jgi:nucleoside-diphosphate-sugar epimerase
MNIVITGGSGFIGTNMVDYYLEKGFNVLNIDMNAPKKKEHLFLWQKCDIRNYGLLNNFLTKYDPDYIIHLAATTGLSGKSLEDYSSNIAGVENIIKISGKLTKLKKTVYTSSMLVCKAGYYPRHDEDYCPTTLYGESKVIGERVVRNSEAMCAWSIIRPTSIWGPWFGRTYREFFELIQKKRYFKISGGTSIKTYGYIGNAVYQIDSILFSELSNGKTLYIGDYQPTRIDEWAEEIARHCGSTIYSLPRFMVRTAAYLGDLLGTMNIRFPMNSFRFSNMTTDNILDLSNTKVIAPDIPFTRNQGNTITLEWMKLHRS